MKLLAIDSAGLVASIAVLEDDNLLAEYTVNYKKTHSRTLLPMLDAVAQMIDLEMDTVDAVAVAGGPGSFTGLRIGSATAKGLGLALDIPLISVPTVDAIAYNLCGHDGLVAPMMDARRDQVYCGIYHFAGDGTELCADLPQQPRSVAELVGEINARGEAVTVLGDGIPVHLDVLKREIAVPLRVAPPHLARQRAGALAALAAQYFRAGKTQTAAEHAPDYLRLSQAERERAEREEKQGRT